LNYALSYVPEDQQLDFHEGLLLPVMEEFYSLQGEGNHTGKPAWFIRIGGCDVCCSWCDVKESWDPSLHPLVHLDKIVENALSVPVRSVVVTGGEPLQFNLSRLCAALHKHDFKLFLETSGSHQVSGDWDWVCLSPKRNAPPLPDIYTKADELKVVISSEKDFEWAVMNAKKVKPKCMLVLQPEWSVRITVIPIIVDFILQNPSWNLSLQSHKYIGIP